MQTRVLLALVALALAACSSGTPSSTGSPTSFSVETTPSSAPPTTAKTGRPSASPPVSCDAADCHVLAVGFPSPLSLEEVRGLAASANTAVVAVWRTEPVCVHAVGGPPVPGPDEALEPSNFAYVDADVIREVQSQGPPATDGGWSLAVRDRFATEWEAAAMPGVEFEGAALLSFDPRVVSPGIASQEEVEWYLTDVTRVLYLRGHWQQLEQVFGIPEGEC